VFLYSEGVEHEAEEVARIMIVRSTIILARLTW
jgi:hypothetical protein